MKIKFEWKVKSGIKLSLEDSIDDKELADSIITFVDGIYKPNEMSAVTVSIDGGPPVPIETFIF